MAVSVLQLEITLTSLYLPLNLKHIDLMYKMSVSEEKYYK